MQPPLVMHPPLSFAFSSSTHVSSQGLHLPKPPAAQYDTLCIMWRVLFTFWIAEKYCYPRWLYFWLSIWYINLPKYSISHSKYNTKAQMGDSVWSSMDENINQYWYRVETMNKKVQNLCRHCFQHFSLNNNWNKIIAAY